MFRAEKNFVTKTIKLLTRSFGQYKLVLVGLFLLSLLNGVLEGIGITVVIPIFSFVNHSQPSDLDFISKYIQKFFYLVGIPYTLKFLLIFIVALFIAKAIVLFFTNYVTAVIAANYEKYVRKELFDITMQSDWSFLIKQKMGHLDQLLTTHVNTASGVLFTLASAALILTKFVVYVLVAINLSLSITLLALFFGVVTFFLFKPLFYKNKFISEGVERTYKNLAHFVNENIIGMKNIKAMSAEEPVMAQGSKYFNDVRSFNIKVAVIRYVTSASIQPIGILFIMVIFWFSYKTSLFNLGSFAVIVYAINQIFTQLQLIQGNVHAISSGVPYLKGINDYKEHARCSREIDEGKKDFVLDRELRFIDVSFAYNNGKEILSHLNFAVKKGEMVGIIGPSGAGKTTAVDLLLRLFRLSGGTITLDSVNIDEISLKKWRTNVAYVSQDIFLMNDTIMNNIRFYNTEITEAEIFDAARLANIHEFIEQLPEKYNTVIGERGTRLSNGQRQRIVLARIMARRQQILILDEATSALDNESETLIQQAIDNLKGKLTILVIAHRLSTVMSADSLLVLDDGKIIEQGPAAKLLEDHESYFYKVYNIRK